MEQQKRTQTVQKQISAIYRGIGHITKDPVAGKLRFGAPSDGGGACVAVLLENCSDERLASVCDDPSTVAFLFVGEGLPHDVRHAAEARALPLLSLECLPAVHDGAFAILDTKRERLIVNPDVDTLTHYALGTCPATHPPLCPALSDSLRAMAEDGSVSGYLLFAPTGEENGDALFERYRDAAEAAAPAPLLVRLPFRERSQEGSQEAVEETEAHVQALLRASVFGPVVLLWDGLLSPRALTQADALIARVCAALSREGREYDAQMRSGLWISSPLSLFLLPRFPPRTHVGLDISRLLPAALGIQADEPPSSEALCAFWEMLSLSLQNRKAAFSLLLDKKDMPSLSKHVGMLCADAQLFYRETETENKIF